MLAASARARLSRDGGDVMKRPPPLPPLLLVLLLGVLTRTLAHAAPAWRWDWAYPPTTAGVAACIGLAFNVWPKFAFQRARTTVNPLRPDAASQVVTDGPYRFTRNPMYVGHALLLAGWAIGLAHPLAFIGPLAYIVWIDRLQIPAEEAALAARFPAAFADYARRVRRWL